LSDSVLTPHDQTTEVRSRRQVTSGDLIVLFGVFGLLLCAPLAFGAVQSWARFALEAVAASLFVVWAIQQIRSGEVRIIGNPLFAPMLAFGVFAVLQLIAGFTAYRFETKSQLALYGAYATLCFLAVQCLRRTRQIKILAATFTGYGLVISMFAILQSLSSNGKLYWVRMPSSGGWVYGPYVNHNHYAGLIEMLLPVALVTALSHYSRGLHKVVASLAAVLMAATVFLCGSRGGMLAFVVQMAILCAVLLRHKRDRRLVLGFGIFAVLVVALLAGLADNEMVSRVFSIHSEARGELSGGTRLTIDRDGLRMFARRPLSGWGLGTFSEVYPQFRSFYSDFRINAAHNDYLQLLVEMGIPGFAVMFWFLVAVYRTVLTKLEHWPANINGAIALAAMLGVSGILVHSFVDFNLQIPANAALFYVLCTVAAMEPRFSMSRRSGT